MGKKKQRGYGEGAIYQRRSDGRWVTSVSLGYDAEGKRKRRTLYGKTKTEVQNKLKALYRDQALGRPIEPSRITVTEHFGDWLRVQKQYVASSTYDAYETKVAHILSELGPAKLKDLDYRQVNVFYDHLDRIGLSKRMSYDIASLLRRGLEDAVRKRLIYENPARLAASRSKGKHEARYLNHEELEAFLWGAKFEPLYPSFVLAAHTGLRPGELLGLPWTAFSPRKRQLKVSQSLHEEKGHLFIGTPKTPSSYRTFGLSSVAVDALKFQRKLQAKWQMEQGGEWGNDDNLVFTTKSGGYVRRNNILKKGRMMDRICRRAALYRLAKRVDEDPERLLLANPKFMDGLTRRERLSAGDSLQFPSGHCVKFLAHELLEDVVLHTFRHTHVALLIDAGVDMLAISRRIGHADVETTYSQYGHLMPGADEKAVEALDDLASENVEMWNGYNLATL